MKKFAIVLASAGILFAAGGKQTITGVVTDTMCEGDHKGMNMGPDPKCVRECVKMDPKKWKYGVYDGKTTWILSDQKGPEKFAAKKVTVTGTVDEKTKTIQVESMSPAK